MLNVHGEYPFDVIRVHGKPIYPWERVRDLTPAEASVLLGLYESLQRPAAQSDIGGGPDMLNKGFIVIRLHKQGLEGPDPLTHHFTGMTGGKLLPKDLQVGDEAVYQHDFKFSLIRYIGAVQ